MSVNISQHEQYLLEKQKYTLLSYMAITVHISSGNLLRLLFEILVHSRVAYIAPKAIELFFLPKIGLLMIL